MTLYESNIQYIKKQYPSLLSILEYEGEKSIEPILTRNGEPNLKITKNDRSYYLHSRYHAREDARKWVQSIENEIIEVKHILIIGVGLGYYLEELLTICKHKDIFILEPSTEIFIEWLKTRNVTNVLSNSQIRLMAVGENEYLPLQISSEIARFI